MPYGTPLYGIFLGMFSANMGGGGGLKMFSCHRVLRLRYVAQGPFS